LSGIGTNNRVALAASSTLASDAGAEIAELGGNAIDCCIAAAMCSINTEPGVCSLAGGAYITIWEPGANDNPVTIDGNVAIPGRGTGVRTPAPGPADRVSLEYGGGVDTLVGAASVAVPGTLAALYLAAQQYGRLPWSTLLAPTIRAASEGFPLPAACRHYLQYSGKSIYGRSDAGYRALHAENGAVRDTGSLIVVPDLADTLAAIAEGGADVFYRGDIARKILTHVRAGGGTLTEDDLVSYQAQVRDSLCVNLCDWRFAMNPAPAIGGANLAAMLLAFGDDKFSDWDDHAVGRLLDVQQTVMSYRKQTFDKGKQSDADIHTLLEIAHDAGKRFSTSGMTSSATVHTSAVDTERRGCSITASSGYGSGEMPEGTGLWLNNCLGELELNTAGLSAGPVGARLPSNMAPGVARRADGVLAFGSPGADRITTALHQFICNFVLRGLELDSAVRHPRMHLNMHPPTPVLAIEPGLRVPKNTQSVRRFEEPDMYFGGVVATLVDQNGQLQAAADSRREGGTYLSS